MPTLESLSTELRLQIYSYLVFDAPEPPPPTFSVVHILRNPDGPKGNLSHCFCKELPSLNFAYSHTMHSQVDSSGAQPCGKLLHKMGEARPFVTLKSRTECKVCADPPSRSCRCAGPRMIHSLLVANRMLAVEIRPWLYCQFYFSFHPSFPEDFALFLARLSPDSRNAINALRVTVPICKLEGIEKVMNMFSRKGDKVVCDWVDAIPRDIVQLLPNVRSLHLSLMYFAWCTTLDKDRQWAPPDGDPVWREDALGGLLALKALPLEVVSVDTGDACPTPGSWTTGQKFVELSELTMWLQERLIG